MIDGKPLWMFTKLMSVRDLRPWEVDAAPVVTMTIFWATTNAYADGRRRADREADDRKADDERTQAAQAVTDRVAARRDRFFQAMDGGGEEDGDGVG